MYLSWYLFIYAINHVSLQAASFAYIICPILTTVLAFILLKEKIIKENSEYLKKYRTESDKQSDLYGHFSTPAYEKKMYALKVSLAKSIEAYKDQIEQIKMLLKY